MMYIDKRLWPFTAGSRLRIATTVLLGIASTIFGVGRLALLGWVLGKIILGAHFSELLWAFVAIALVMLGRGILEYARTMHAHHTSSIIQLRLQKRIYDHVVALGPGHFGQHRTGDTVLSIVDDVEQLETYFGQYLPHLIVAILTPIGIFSLVAFLDLPIATIMIFFALLTLIAPAVFHRWESRNSKARRKAYGSFGAEFLDSVQGLATLKAFGQSGARIRLLADKAQTLLKTTMWVLATSSISRGITDCGIALGAAVSLTIGAYRVLEGSMDLSVLLIVLLMGIEVFRPLRELRILLHQGMLGASAAEGIINLLREKPTVDDNGESNELEINLQPSIEFRDVQFTYPGTQVPVHDTLNVNVAPGARMGIVGASGSGKSTIVRLLERLYDPDEGSILVGGEDIRTISLSTLRKQIALVNQDTYLFHGTVRDNLLLGKPNASMGELKEAASLANADQFIGRLPHGYDTIVGERGIRLSGGQRQRIAIARALLRDAPILVLDEALSAVDAENEAEIQEALNHLMSGRTTLIIAHRLSSIINADRIIVLHGGAVAESGTHAELMALGKLYSKLMRDQVGHSTDFGSPPVLASRGIVQDEFPDFHKSESDHPSPTDTSPEDVLGWGRAIKQLTSYVAPWRVKLSLAFGFGVARVVAFIGVGILSALTVLAIKNGQYFDALVIALLIVAPTSGLLHWFESWIAHDVAFRLLAEMRVNLFKKLDKLGPAYTFRRRTGDLVSMATQDIETVEYFFAHTVAPAFVAVLVPTAVIVTLLVFGPLMALALLPFLILIGISPFIFRSRIDRLGSLARESLGELNAYSVDTIQGLTEILAFQMNVQRGHQFVDRIRQHHRTRIAFLSDLAAQNSLLEIAMGLGGLAVVVTGNGLVTQGTLESGVLPLLVILAMSAFLPISEISNVGRQLADTLGATRRLHTVHREPITICDGTYTPTHNHAKQAANIDIDSISFTYHGSRESALVDVSFPISSGSTVALVGTSGAGKTTIAHLLMRFWDPDSGLITINGVDVREYQLDDLHNLVALVAQDTYLFNDTLRNNILIARPNAKEHEVVLAVEKAALEETVSSFPNGLSTKVGERGVMLSGGQRQRVSIARAFLKDAPILILDEATSHLDAVNERQVRNSLISLMHRRTTLVIAHRLSTIREADFIVVLDQGRMIEGGTHSELLDKGGLYTRLTASQISEDSYLTD